VATIPDGVEVSEFLKSAGFTGDAWVTAVGTVSDVELAVAGATGEVTRSAPGPATLISLVGPASGPLMAVLASAEAGVLAGRLVRAVSGGVIVRVPTSSDAHAGPGAGRTAAPLPNAAKSTAPDADEEADELPVQGDRIDHFVFGLCDVMVVTGERFKIREAGGGKLREIHVGPFRLSKPVVRDGKRVFKLVKRS